MKITGRHLLVLVSMCGLLATTVGLVTNVAGLFFTPVAEELGILKGEVSLMLTICNISFAFGGLFSPKITSKLNPRIVLIGCTVVLAGCTAALTLCHAIMPMYVLCAARGFAAGIIGFVFATTVLSGWFVESIGLATSIAMGCSGIAGAAFSPVLSGIIAGSGWRVGYLAVAAFTVALNLPAILSLPAINAWDAGIAPFGAKESDRPAPAAAGSAQSDTAQDKATASKLPMAIFAAVLIFSVRGSACTAFPQHFPGMAEIYGFVGTGATMLSVSMVANTAGKIALGALIDRFGTRISVLGYIAAVIASLVAMLLVPSPAVFVVSAGAFGLCYAIGTVGITMLTRDAFGVENYSRTYPVMSLGGNIANAVFSSVVGYMYDFTGGYTSTMIMFIVSQVITAGCVIFVYAQKSKQLQAAA